ncbi:MAG: helix-turn-helix domain-containing protein [Tannerellaceae bacterium]|nr:helix-turn-helix domain-containing protein [Tannerellaceae bacterium]
MISPYTEIVILKKIQRIMKDNEMSQDSLAKKIGMKQSGLSLILSGNRALKYSVLYKISEALEIDIVDLLQYGDMVEENIITTTAIAAMQGLLSNPNIDDTPEWIAKTAYQFAHALHVVIKNSNQTEQIN